MIQHEKGMVNRGNWSAIQRCMAKAAAGEPITVGFLGGSITQGSLASVPEKCYAYRVYRWWQETFPQSGITFINAGIGGTTSQFGAARVGEDLLRHKPDFVLTEFSVNDHNTPHFQETYEGLIRTILAQVPALLLMHNVCYDTGNSAEDIHLAVGQHYDLPCVSMKSTIYAKVASGEIPNRDITPDDLHPNDLGHQLVAEVIIHMLQRIHSAPMDVPGPAALPVPLTKNRYETSIRHQNHNCVPVLQGWTADHTPQNHITETFRRGFTAWEEGSTITFDIHCSCVAVQYRKSVHQPTPIAKVTVDGAHEMLLDGNFRETWGDCLYIDTVYESDMPQPHQVTVEIVEAHEKDAVPFYLVSVIGG